MTAMSDESDDAGGKGGAVNGATGGAVNGTGPGPAARPAGETDQDRDRDHDGGRAADGAGKRKRGGWGETVLLIAGGVAVALLLRMFVVGTFWIPSESMENTLVEHDRVVVNLLSGSPRRGDIVVFKGWDGTDWIKRVIAVGGDTVTCCDSRHRISVNGVPLDEDYLYPGDHPAREDFEVKVPKGRLWVMGDHRTASRDSRYYQRGESDGTISEDAVLGRAWAVYWPPSRMKFLSTPATFEKTR